MPPPAPRRTPVPGVTSSLFITSQIYIGIIFVWLLLDNFLAFYLQQPRHQGEEEAREHVAHSSGALHSHWSGGRSREATAAFHWSDSPGHLLYEGDGDEDPLSEEDEEADDHEEDDAEDAGEGEPRVALLQEVLHNVRGPVQLK